MCMCVCVCSPCSSNLDGICSSMLMVLAGVLIHSTHISVSFIMVADSSDRHLGSGDLTSILTSFSWHDSLNCGGMGRFLGFCIHLY